MTTLVIYLLIILGLACLGLALCKLTPAAGAAIFPGGEDQ